MKRTENCEKNNFLFLHNKFTIQLRTNPFNLEKMSVFKFSSEPFLILKLNE